MNKVLMIQTSQYCWQIESEKGAIIQKEIYCNNPHKAEEYVKNFISSFRAWTFELVPVKEEKSKCQKK